MLSFLNALNRESPFKLLKVRYTLDNLKPLYIPEHLYFDSSSHIIRYFLSSLHDQKTCLTKVFL